MSEDTVPLVDGGTHPLKGFGTYKVAFIPASASGTGGVAIRPEGEDCEEIVKWACDAGYRMFDCANFYGNEKEVGQALRKSGIPREELFIVNKVWNSTIHAGGAAVRAQVLQSLEDMGLEYFDVFLIHWPVPTKHVEAYLALEGLYEEGKIRHLGVSNYTVEDYLELKPHIKVPVSVNQIEVNPSLFRKNTIAFFQNEGIVVQAYRSLGNGKLLQHSLVQELCKKHDVSPSTILGSFLMQQNIVYIGKSSKKERIFENFNTNVTLTEEELEKLRQLTTPENIKAHIELYRKCVVRDTPLAEAQESFVKGSVTED